MASALFSLILDAAPVVDLDGDGFSDIWEVAFDAQNLVPQGDEDGDGSTNLQECENGTDPFDADSLFTFEGIEPEENGIAFNQAIQQGTTFSTEFPDTRL